MDEISLKWGTLKGWNLKSEKAIEILDKYLDLGDVSFSVMSQNDTDAQFDALLELIDVADCDSIHNDWSGEDMTKDQAKEYLITYRAKRK